MDVFSNLMVIGECLLDDHRTESFIQAIQETVQPGMVALDVGTGSGILAMASARAGAKKVFAVDIADDIVHFAKKNVRQNELENIVEVIHADAKTLTHLPRVDVLTMELMDTGMVGEQQAPVINSLHEAGIITSNTKLIPYRYQCAATLIEYDFHFYGFYMPFVIQARNFGVESKIQKKLSQREVYADIDFSHNIDTHVDTTVTVSITDSGEINALILESQTFLSPQRAIWGTTDLNMPVIIPLEPQQVSAGQSVMVHIEYFMAEGFDKFTAEIR